MRIGCHVIETPIALAPMAGITDKPFRQLAKQYGAGYTVSEMLTSDPLLRNTRKTLSRSDHSGETGVIAVQIAGSIPEQMAEAARYNVAQGAQVIDINMGCPAKKVCHVLAGSALLQNEQLVNQILQTVVKAVDVPVTLKTRLGFSQQQQNIRTIAKMAEQAGIAALAIHGRTREQMYRGAASYDLIAQVKQDISIPVWVNGDITRPQQAANILQQTGADGVMIGRGAQGQPWLFADIKQYLQYATLPPALTFTDAADTVLKHLFAMHQFYGETAGVRIARKHLAWYFQRLPEGEGFRQYVNTLNDAAAQYDAVAHFLATRELSVWPSDYR